MEAYIVRYTRGVRDELVQTEDDDKTVVISTARFLPSDILHRALKLHPKFSRINWQQL